MQNQNAGDPQEAVPSRWVRQVRVSALRLPLALALPSGVVGRVAEQGIVKQHPEKARLVLILRTDDCNSLETEIHDELKRKGKWIDPAVEKVDGREWFLTNPGEVKRIYQKIYHESDF